MRLSIKRHLAQIFTILLMIIMTIGFLPQLGTLAYAASGDKEIDGLGTSSIGNPQEAQSATSPWIGNYVYYGKYNNAPVKYRVLTANTSDYGGTTMLLDCDSVLLDLRFDNDGNTNTGAQRVNEWAYSDVRTNLNGNTFLNSGGFSDAEKAAIAESRKAKAANGDGQGVSNYGYAALNGDKIFLLDVKEVTRESYGYETTGSGGTGSGRIKSGAKSFWWLRSPSAYNYAAVSIDDSGCVSHRDTNWEKVGVSPAFNVNLKSVLFSSEVSSESTDTSKTYKLTVKDEQMTISEGSVSASWDENTITVSYSITGDNKANANHVSLLITNKDDTWTTESGWSSGAKKQYYTTAAVTDVSGTVTFMLPAGYETNRDDWNVWLLAEKINGTYETDYASAPVAITTLKPTFSPAGGRYTEVQNVTISCGTDGAKIYYTTDGSNPTTSSSVYNTAIAVSETTTIKAMAVKDGIQQSEIAEATYIFTPYTNLVNTTTTVRFNGYDWYIIEDDSTAANSGTVTLLVKDPIHETQFSNELNNAYNGSNVKKYLDGLTTGTGKFANVENAIVGVDLTDVNVTGAKLWLLSKTEVNTTYNLSENVRKCSHLNNSNIDGWWLRSPGKDNFCATFVFSEDSKIYDHAAASVNTCGVRPALKLNLSSVIFSSVDNTYYLGSQTISALDVSAAYGDTDKRVSATVTNPATDGGTISYTVKEGSENYISVNASTGLLTINKVPADGKAYVIVTAAATDTYTKTTKEVAVTISKANPAAPTDLTATYGQTLKDVTLPDGWTWVDSAQSVGNVVSPAGTFKANFAGNDNYNSASNVDVIVTVGKAPQTAPGAPTEESKTSTSVTLKQEKGYQYSLDGNNWQDSNFFDGLTANTEYSFYQRLAGDDNHDPSPESSETKIKTTQYTIVFDHGPVASGTMDPVGVFDNDEFTFPVCIFNAPQYKTFDHWEMSGVDGWFDPNGTNKNVTIVQNCADEDGVITVTANWRFTNSASVTTEPSAKDPTYTGSDQELVTEGAALGGTMNYAFGTDTATVPTTGWGTSVPAGEDAGVYYIWYRAKGDESHGDSEANCCMAEIKKRTVTLTSENGEKPYDGSPLTKPDVTVGGDGFVIGEVSDVKATGSVTTVAEGEVTNTISYTEGAAFKADNYSIRKTEGKLKITASTKALVIGSSTKSWPYDGQTHADEVYTVTYDGATVSSDEGSSGKVFTLPTGDKVTITSTAAGVKDYDESYSKNNTYTYVIGNAGSYSDVTVNVGTLAITKVGPSVIAPEAKTELVYSGSEQALVKGGSVIGGTLYYAVTTENTAPDKGWIESIPTAAKAGTFYVWYKVVGDNNHNGTNPVSVEAEIEKKSATVTAKAQTIYESSSIQRGTDQAILSNAAEGHTLSAVTLTEYAARITPSAAKIVDTDKKDVTENYKISYEDGKLTIIYAISATVRFKVVNGSWNDGTTKDKTVALNGYEGDILKLAANQIPEVGSKPETTYKAGSWNVTPSAETAIREDTTYIYSYAPKEKISADVTFKVANGSWNDGSTKDKTVTLTGYEGDILKLEENQIPEVGSKPNATYKVGSWDVTPSTETKITEATTYTYNYAPKERISADVTFKVVNGSWNDETAENKTVTLTGYEGDILKLSVDQIPEVGSKPDATYKAGSWDITPGTETEITEATTYTYCYVQKDSISANVTFKVVNGSWNDETAENKTVTLTGYEGDILKLAEGDIPAVGSKPDDGYIAGSWNIVPSTETEIKADTAYTYTYLSRAEVLAPEKEAAKNELDKLLLGKKEADYDAEDWTALKKAIEDGKTAIDNATTVEDIDKAKNNTISTVNDVKTKAQKKDQSTSLTEAQVESMLLSMTNDKDLEISNFGGLQVRQKRVKNKQITIQWRKYPGATSYTIYGARCGTKLKKLKTVKGTTYTKKKLKKGKYYKFVVVANGGGNALSVSKMTYIAMSGGKNGNDTKLRVNKRSLKLEAGKSARLKVKVVKQTGKVRNYRKNQFESSDTKVATVDKQGKVKAVGNGKCVIYCYAQNGLFKKVKVVVK